jgi:hypothetical protein
VNAKAVHYLKQKSMEQIQQHKWAFAPSYDTWLCYSCSSLRKIDANGDWIYQTYGAMDWGPTKPKCITRTINATASDKVDKQS